MLTRGWSLKPHETWPMSPMAVHLKPHPSIAATILFSAWPRVASDGPGGFAGSGSAAASAGAGSAGGGAGRDLVSLWTGAGVGFGAGGGAGASAWDRVIPGSGFGAGRTAVSCFGAGRTEVSRLTGGMG